MNKTTEGELPLGTTAPFATMHKWLQRGLFVCLTCLVVEGAFTLPGILIWMGYPTLSMTEICSELEKVRFADETRECIAPYPLFATSEGRGQKTAQDDWGIQPKPLYKAIGFRDLVKYRDERLARQAAEKAASTGVPVNAGSGETEATPPSGE